MMGRKKIAHLWRPALGVLPSWMQSHPGGWIFAIALILRLSMVFGSTPGPDVYDNELQKVARNLARGTFSGPFPCETGPTAIVPPAYPVLLAPIYKWSTKPEIPIGILSSTAAALTYALLPSLAVAGGLDLSVGIIAGSLGAVAPYLPGLEARGPWGEPFVTLFLLLAIIRMMLLTSRSPVVCGVLWGITFLFGPQALPVFLSQAAYFVWRGLRKPVVIVSLSCVLVVAPWIIRNYIQLGGLFWIRSGAGLELYLSNNPEAKAVYNDNIGSTKSYYVHPSLRRGGCPLVQEMGEIGYFNFLGAKSLRWIRENPAKFVRLTSERVWYFWSVPGIGRPRWAYTMAVTALGMVGVFLWLRRGARCGIVGVTVLLVFPLFYYAFQANPRYRAPIEPILYLGTAETLFAVARRQRKREH